MTTFTPPSASVTRRVAVGLSAGASGADGVPELAQSAHEALMRAPWVESPDDAPSMPVHDNGQTSNRSVPSGDAWKCGYGYDATNRTERAAAGAVCYSFALPRAMVAETDAAAVTGLSVRVIGDRYLDAGARVFAALTGSAQPPTLAEMLGAEAASAVVCATSGQTKPDGETPLAPNNRAGVRADAEITPATPLAAPEGATAAYLHVCLALADYTTTRGAWIEGGAMLAPDTLSVAFDREVESDRAVTDAALSLGRFDSAADNAQSGPSSRRQDTYALTLSAALLDTLADDTADERAAHILAAALQTPSPLLGSASMAQHSDAAFGIGRTSLASTVISRSGLVPAGRWTVLRCAVPFKAPCDALAHVFAIVGPTAMTSAAIDGAAEAATASVCLDWSSVIRRAAFVDAPPDGGVARLSSGLSNGAFSTSASAPIALRHLGTARLIRDGIYSEIPLSTPLEIATSSRELVTVVIQFAPIGPGGGIESVTATSRVLETLAFSDTYSVKVNDYDFDQEDDPITWQVLEYCGAPYVITTQTGTDTVLRVEITGGLQRVYVAAEPWGDAANAQLHHAYLPAGEFSANGRSLHWAGRVFYFGEYVGAAHVTPQGTNVVYDRDAGINKTVAATIDASAVKTLTVPVFETVDGVEVPRGTATIRTRFLSCSHSISGVNLAFHRNTLRFQDTIAGSHVGNGGSLLNGGWKQEISVQYYHEIIEETAEFETTETFALPELSLASR